MARQPPDQPPNIDNAIAAIAAASNAAQIHPAVLNVVAQVQRDTAAQVAGIGKLLNTAVPNAAAIVSSDLRYKANLDRAALETALQTGHAAEFLARLVDQVDLLADRVERADNDRTRQALRWIATVAAVVAAVAGVILLFR